MPQNWVGVLVARLVVPVQVPPSQGAAIIAHYNSVWVQHGHHFEDEGITKCLVKDGEGRVKGRDYELPMYCRWWSIKFQGLHTFASV